MQTANEPASFTPRKSLLSILSRKSKPRKHAPGESEAHIRCKTEIYKALLKQAGVTKAALECPLGTNRPDVSAYINGVPVAIEVQISSLSMDQIAYRTVEYFRKGVYVLWLLQWTPELENPRYSPSLWEKWIHAAYFGNVYYWIEGLSVVNYRFDAYKKHVPKFSFFQNGRKVTKGGYSRASIRYRNPVRGEVCNLATDFKPKEREWWKGDGFAVPSAKLFIHRELKL